MRLAMKLDWRIVAPLLIVIAGILWGVIGLFSTALSSAGLEPVQITVVRCTIAACFLGIVLAIFKPHAFKIHLRHIWVFLGTGVLSIAFYNVCYFACIELCGLSFAAILLYTAPCFVVLLSAFFFKEKLTAHRFGSLVLAFLGCLLVVGVGSGNFGLSGFGILLGLASGIGYAFYSLFARVALKHYEPLTVMFYTFVCAALALIPFSHPVAIVDLALNSSSSLVIMLALSLVSTVLPLFAIPLVLLTWKQAKHQLWLLLNLWFRFLLGSWCLVRFLPCLMFLVS